MNRVVSPARRSANASSRPESEAVVKFRKVLELELRRGCDDGAVIGGIDGFLADARHDKGVAADDRRGARNDGVPRAGAPSP